MINSKLKSEKVIVWLERVTEFSLYTMIFTLPFSKSMVEISFVFALTSWIMKRYIRFIYPLSLPAGRQALNANPTCYMLKDKILGLIKAFKPVKTDLNLPIAGFVFIGFLSMIYSVLLPLSLEGFFLKLFEWIMIYFIVVETINSRKKVVRILVVLLSSMALIAIDGIFQFITGTDFIRHYPIHVYRIQGPFGNPNSFAGWLVIMVPFVLSLAYFWKNNWINQNKWFRRIIRPLFWLITGLLIVCLALTYTRGVWVAVLLSLIFLGIIRSKRLLIVIIIALLALPFITPDSIKERISSIMNPEDIPRIIRINLWRGALEIIEDFPLVGCGLNTYSIAIRDYKIIKEAGLYPHNSYLHMAAESGLLGLGAFIWIMITLFKVSLVNLKRISNGFHSGFLVGLLAGLFGFLAHSFVDTNIYTLQLGNLMWFIMGLIIAVQKVSLQNRQ